MKWHASLDPWAVLLFRRLWLGDKKHLLKKRQGRNPRTEGNATVICMLSAKISQSFTFITGRCSLQLTQCIFTFCVRRSLRTTNFIACECRFADDFVCKITACGPLIYWWCYWKMFTVNFYASCCVSKRNSIGKNLEDLIWKRLFTGRYLH